MTLVSLLHGKTTGKKAKRQSVSTWKRLVPRLEALEDRCLLSGGITEFPLPSPNSTPYSITTGPGDNLWFTESSPANRVGRITPSGTVIGEYPVPTANSGIDMITAGPDGNLWFTEYQANKIGRVNIQDDPITITEFTVPTPASQPNRITAGPDGNVWFTEHDGNKIGQITPDGAITEFPIPAAASGPEGITTGQDGKLWFSESYSNKIGQITPDGAITEFTVPTPNSSPYVIATAPDGSLWFGEHDANKIASYNPTSNTFAEYPIPTGDARNGSIATGPDGIIWFVEPNNNKVGGFDPATNTFMEFPIPTANSMPQFITLGPDGNLWFTEYSGNQIAQLIPDQPLSATGVDVTGAAGQTLTHVLVATFSDADPLAGSPGNYVAQINWGDGSLSSGGFVTVADDGTFEVRGDHLYIVGGSFTVTVTITDTDTSHDVGRYTVSTTSTAEIAPLTFTDDFEGPTLDPFWTVTAQSGSVRFPSTAQAHSGNQSVEFDSTATSQQKDIELYHVFPVPVYGDFSVWIYDTGANVSSSNYISFTLFNSQTYATLSAWDYNFGDGATYNGGSPTDGFYSAIPRTEAWHQFEINATATSTTYTIDGAVVHTGPGMGVERVALSMSGPYWRPAGVSYFDDFAFTQEDGGGGAPNFSAGAQGVASASHPDPLPASTNHQGGIKVVAVVPLPLHDAGVPALNGPAVLLPSSPMTARSSDPNSAIHPEVFPVDLLFMLRHRSHAGHPDTLGQFGPDGADALTANP
jgi:virginiamycin B lyase